MEQTKTLAIIGIVAVCTFFTRILPFIIFRKKQELPENVKYLGNILPMAVMAILVIYCLKDINYMEISNVLPALISVAAVVLIHIWKRSNLLSIGSGTVIYMILVQAVF